MDEKSDLEAARAEGEEEAKALRELAEQSEA